MNHLTSDNYVVYTYAAICIEKILTLKIEGKPMYVSSRLTFYLILRRYTSTQLQPVARPLLDHLFNLLAKNGNVSQKLSENDYLMRTILRILFVNGEHSAAFAPHILQQLTGILSVIAQNPSNPKFNHCVFESIAAVVRFAGKKDLAQVEQLIFPPFQAILASDVAGKSLLFLRFTNEKNSCLMCSKSCPKFLIIMLLEHCRICIRV